MRNYNETPPQSYIVIGNGFKLNSTVDYPQSEIDENQKSFDERNDELTDIISDNVNKLNELSSQKGEFIGQISEIDKQLADRKRSPEERKILEIQK
jgi:hypothetical protein